MEGCNTSEESAERKKVSWSSICILLLIIVAIGLSFFINPILVKLMGTKTPLAVVSSYSMEPTLRLGDLIVVCGSTSYNVGDVIVFKRGYSLIVHRIIDVQGGYLFRTKGDANRAPDLRPVKLEDIEGKVVLVVPYIGVITLLHTKAPFLVMALIFLIVILGIILTVTEKEERGNE